MRKGAFMKLKSNFGSTSQQNFQKYSTGNNCKDKEDFSESQAGKKINSLLYLDREELDSSDISLMEVWCVGLLLFFVFSLFFFAFFKLRNRKSKTNNMKDMEKEIE